MTRSSGFHCTFPRRRRGRRDLGLVTGAARILIPARPLLPQGPFPTVVGGPADAQKLLNLLPAPLALPQGFHQLHLAKAFLDIRVACPRFGQSCPLASPLPYRSANAAYGEPPLSGRFPIFLSHSASHMSLSRFRGVWTKGKVPSTRKSLVNRYNPSPTSGLSQPLRLKKPRLG